MFLLCYAPQKWMPSSNTIKDKRVEYISNEKPCRLFLPLPNQLLPSSPSLHHFSSNRA